MNYILVKSLKYFPYAIHLFLGKIGNFRKLNFNYTLHYFHCIMHLLSEELRILGHYILITRYIGSIPLYSWNENFLYTLHKKFNIFYGLETSRELYSNLFKKKLYGTKLYYKLASASSFVLISSIFHNNFIHLCQK